MQQRAKFKISVSITDSPFLAGFESMLAGFKASGVDGLEIVPGYKSRFNLKKIEELSKKYSLPILSFHQPPWSVLGFWFDENFLAQISNLGVKNITFHPPAGYSFSDDKMKIFLERLGKMQDKYKLNIFLENMPNQVNLPFVKNLLSYHKETLQPEEVFKAAKKFGLGMTLDISHARRISPHEEKWFKNIFSGIRNIHLSSFNDKKDHLPLHLGNFKTDDFIKDLIVRDYRGLLTFEIFYPKSLSFLNYDFESIKKSVDVVKMASK